MRMPTPDAANMRYWRLQRVRGRQITAIAVLLLIVPLLPSCRGPAPVAAEQDGTTLSAEGAVTGFTADNLNVSFARLDLLILNPDRHEEAATAAAAHVNDSDPDVAFAAIYLLGLTGDATNTGALSRALENEHLALRTVAAGTLIGWGAADAVPILINALDSRETIPHSEPITPIANLAIEALPHYTGEDFGLRTATSLEDLTVAKSEWEAWYEEIGFRLEWNETTQRYE